jgi:hypothetical protein
MNNLWWKTPEDLDGKQKKIFDLPLANSTGGHQYTFCTNRIRTLNSWASEFLREQGVTPSRNSDFDKRRRAQLDQIQTAITNRSLNCTLRRDYSRRSTRLSARGIACGNLY